MNTTGFQCGWDSGQVGFIYITHEKARSELCYKRITKKRRAKILSYLVGEVETYDQYLRGDVYGFDITDQDGDHVSSCYGFFGREYAEIEGKAELKHYESEAKKDRFNKLKAMIKHRAPLDLRGSL